MRLTTAQKRHWAMTAIFLLGGIAGCGGESENRVVMPEKYMPVPGPDAVFDPSLGGQSQQAAPAK
jgi:hypothetical protein